MDSAYISKVQKAITYAEEKDRVMINGLAVTFRGNHNTYMVHYDQGRWNCSCGFFPTRGFCSHSMAIDRMLDKMLPKVTTTVS